jgi:glycosyltransferase involved in cell wall biosynthesis
MAKILLNCLGIVGDTMAGPAIRYWEFSKSLSRKHEVILLVPNECNLTTDQFTIIKKTSSYRKLFKEVNVIITMVITHAMAMAAKMNGVKIILDAYDPIPLELLEIYKDYPMPYRQSEHNRITEVLNFSFCMADAVICANENQRDLWTGLMLSQKKITPQMYDKNTSLKNNLEIVPFGLPSKPPKKKGSGPKKIFNLKESDKIVLWGGGIWNWFDPLTLIRAIKKISEIRSDIHLVFMGVKAPSETDVELMSMPAKALGIAKELGVLDKHVFFNLGWIPYEQRTNFLLEADIGVSTHFDHLETRYSFRTRLLDYIWAGLPIINTEGDSFSRLIRQNDIGLTVPYEDVDALAKAIVFLIDNHQERERMKRNLEFVRQEFYWDKIVEPLEEMIAIPKKSEFRFKDAKQIIYSIYKIRGLLFPFKIVTSRISQRLGLSKIA